MTEFQEMIVKQNFAIANMLYINHKENDNILRCIYGKKYFDYINQIDKEFTKCYDTIAKSLEEYEDKVGG